MSKVRKKVRHLGGRGLRASPIAVQDAIRRSSSTLLAALGSGEPGAAVAGSEPVWQSPPVPVPVGVSAVQLEEAFRSWSVNGEPEGHLTGYVSEAISRFLHTWGLVRDESGSCLELGANPYFMTYLLAHYTNLELTLANFYGYRGETVERLSYLDPRGAGRIETEWRSQLFNVEEDDFPFDAHRFDVVVFCEILEHLLMDPVSVMRKIHLALKPSGLLVLTTPNVLRIENVLSLVNGAPNIFDQYSGYGPYGRHNREYTPDDVYRLLEFTGFEVDRSFTADGHPSDPTVWPRYQSVAPLVDFRRHELGQYMFVRARPRRVPKEKLPSFLYRSRPEGEIVP